ncbi:MAG: hypothetical protein M1823_003779 [Watsoniomyces obsoletus]|nr:MAG: hypothetical protein M1823_003779 [Watsoniomyces obsoletus]
MAEPTIYIGPWMDWARGWGNGMTMTLRAQHGQVLTAFLGIFVTIVGSQSWTIVSFIIHQCRAGRSLGDAQHQQIQVTLRNQGTALGAAWQLARLWIPWRTTSSLPQSLLAVGPWMLLALLHGLAWIFAGTMSSYAGKGVGNDFLIRGRTCGYWQPPQIDHQYYQLMDSKDLNDTVTAADYVRLCYDRPQDSPSCNRFVRQSIRWKGDLTNGTNCPFDSSLCRPDNHTSVTMDTGPLDSLQDFGINLRPSERIVYRRVTTCAPLRWQRDFSKMTNVTRTTGKESMTLLRFYFGPFQGANYTYQYNMDSRLTGGGYQLA